MLKYYFDRYTASFKTDLIFFIFILSKVILIGDNLRIAYPARFVFHFLSYHNLFILKFIVSLLAHLVNAVQ